MSEMEKAARSMMTEANSLREQMRTNVLKKLDILDTGPEPLFDAITDHANDITRFGSAALVFIEGDRAFVKSASSGPFHANEERRDSFCNVAVEHDEVLLVPDATLDERFVNNTHVVSGEVRFYIGYPIFDEDVGIGALCVFDREPREVDEDTVELLGTLTAVVKQILLTRKT